MDALLEVLGRRGYELEEGVVSPFRIEDCAELPSCFGNNASSPYATWQFPDPAGALPGGLPSDTEGRSGAWALRQDEAVVYVGRTSPSAAYFSYAPYLFARADDMGEHQTVFASLADARNHTNLGEAPFDREIAIVLTADAALAGEVRRLLERAGLPPRISTSLRWMPRPFASHTTPARIA